MATSSNQRETGHIPVMAAEVLDWLKPESGKLYVDATLGGGGHSEAVLSASEPDGRLIAIDQDALIMAETQKCLASYENRIHYHRGNFSTLEQAMKDAGIARITGGVLADIGVSSFQLDQAERGFSFSKDARLDMRMDTTTGELTAEDVVNDYPEAELVRIFSEYGEERLSKSIAREIVAIRKKQRIQTTGDLTELVLDVYAKTLKRPSHTFRIHPATQVFQALRIEVNDELGHLERFLTRLPDLLAPGARVAVISFHSLEDRIVKWVFREQAKNASMEILTPKPIQASAEETRQNPRSRSAKLRVAARLP